MARRLYIPREVKESIAKHIHESVKKAIDGYLSANEDEDTLTGHLGASLRIKNQKVEVQEEQTTGTWKWSIDYYKFRGRGRNATENFLGADGIFEIQLNTRYRTEKKSLLFQAKKEWSNDKNLFEQCIKMSTWREAAFVLNYTPNEFQAYTLDDVIKSQGLKSKTLKGFDLSEFLNNTYLDCLIGDTDLNYDARARMLTWRAMSGEIVATEFSVDNRLAIKIDAPAHRLRINTNADRVISNAEIYNFRMQADPDEILSLKPEYTEKELDVAYKKLAKTYHSDVFAHDEELLNEIMKRRMQEINGAHDYVYANYKKKR